MENEKLNDDFFTAEEQMIKHFADAEKLNAYGKIEEVLEPAKKGLKIFENDLDADSLDSKLIQRTIRLYIICVEINLDLNKPKDALGFANKAIELQEEHLDQIIKNDQYQTYFLRGHCHKQMENFPDAIADFTKAIVRNPDDFDAYTARGLCYMELGKMVEAIKDFTDSIEINDTNKNTKAYFNRGNCYYCEEDYDKMRNDFEKIIELARWPLYSWSAGESPTQLSTPKNHFYKYIPIVDYQILSLINQEVYFSANTNLNDPLECCLIESAEWFNHCLTENNIKPRIIALTSDPESKLMYSHYANSHTGICVEYKLDFKNLSPKTSYGNVRYENGKSSVENIRDLYMLKNKEWEYEKEFRLVRFDNEEFLDVKIASITFGYKCVEDHRKIIVNLLCSIFRPNDYNEPEYYEMTQVDNSNELKRTPFDPPDGYYITERRLFKLMQKYNFESLFHYQTAAMSDEEHAPAIQKYLDAKKIKKANTGI